MGRLKKAILEKYDNDMGILIPYINDASRLIVEYLFEEDDIEEVSATCFKTIQKQKEPDLSAQSLSASLRVKSITSTAMTKKELILPKWLLLQTRDCESQTTLNSESSLKPPVSCRQAIFFTALL